MRTLAIKVNQVCMLYKRPMIIHSDQNKVQLILSYINVSLRVLFEVPYYLCSISVLINKNNPRAMHLSDITICNISSLSEQ